MKAVLAIGALFLASCASSRVASPPPIEEAAWRTARARLTELRARLVPRAPHGWRVTTRFRDGHTGRDFTARGAFVVAPPDDLRMQLVGPAGALALDVWIDGPRSRLAIPALDRVERTEDATPRPGRPVGFLRWWMLHPLDGRLLWASVDGDRTRLVLRAVDGAVVDVSVDEATRTIVASRRSRLDREHLVAHDAPCGEARYESAAARLRVDVRCDGPTPPPGPRAFLDPDEERP